MFGFWNKPKDEPAVVQNEFVVLTQPAMQFLDLVNTRFPERERLRDRSYLPHSYEQIAIALARMFVVRDDLRPDIRELAMRLATFQDLPEDIRHLAVPLTFPPETEGQSDINEIVIHARKALWETLDDLESNYPGAATCAEKGELGLLIITEDRGWRPESPLDVLNTGGGNA